MNHQKKHLAALLGLALLMLLMGVWFLAARSDVQPGDKTITVEVVHRDERVKAFTYHTEQEYLGALLLEQGLIQGEEGPYGLYITVVDGERADYGQDGAYWALFQGADYATTGADQTPIADGDQFSLVYTLG